MSRRLKTRAEREAERHDRNYWDMPLIQRLYTRVIFASCAFLWVALLFAGSPLPAWGQAIICGLASLAVLLFRMAYPDGMSQAWGWIVEGMAEAAEGQAKAGKPGMEATAKELRQAVNRNDITTGKAAEREIRRAERAKKRPHKKTKKNTKKK